MDNPIDYKGFEFHTVEYNSFKIADDTDIRNQIKAMRDHADQNYLYGQLDIP